MAQVEPMLQPTADEGHDPDGDLRVPRTAIWLIAATVFAAVAVVVLAQPGPGAIVVMVGALPFLTYGPVPRLLRLWARWGAVYAALWIGLVVATTGGCDSLAIGLFAVNAVLTAASRPRLVLHRVAVATVAFGAVGCLAGGPIPDIPWYAISTIAGGLAVAYATGAVVERGRQVDRQMSGLLANTRDFVYRLRTGDDVHEFTYVGGRCEEITGIPADELRGAARDLLARIHPDDLEGLRSTAGPGDQAEVRFRYRHPDGTWRWWHDRVVVLERHRDGQPRLVQGHVQDITTQQEHERALQEALASEQAATANLRRLDALRTTFLQAVSHELRTPLTSILGFAATLRRHELGEAARGQLLERVEVKAEELRDLLDDLLDVDRLTRGVAVELEETPVADSIAGVVRSVDVEDRDLQLELRGGPDDRVLVDRVRFERIVANLLKNAVRHTPPGTTIRVTAECEGPDLVLQVSDDGPGVPDAERERIFELFAQGDAAADAPSPGTGVGLALVREFARSHGGRAWVETSPSGGATFVVRLPACVMDAARPPHAEHAGRADTAAG